MVMLFFYWQMWLCISVCSRLAGHWKMQPWIHNKKMDLFSTTFLCEDKIHLFYDVFTIAFLVACLLKASFLVCQPTTDDKWIYCYWCRKVCHFLFSHCRPVQITGLLYLSLSDFVFFLASDCTVYVYARGQGSSQRPLQKRHLYGSHRGSFWSAEFQVPCAIDRIQKRKFLL